MHSTLLFVTFWYSTFSGIIFIIKAVGSNAKKLIKIVRIFTIVFYTRYRMTRKISNIKATLSKKFIPRLFIMFRNPNNDAFEFSTSILSTPRLNSILRFIFLSSSIISLPSVSSFITSAISDNSYAPGKIIERTEVLVSILKDFDGQKHLYPNQQSWFPDPR